MDIQVVASGSTGNCYSISDGKTRLLIEAGIPVAEIQRAVGYRLTGCDACLVTHAHGDHAKHAAALAKKTVDIYASAGTIEACGLTGHRIHAVKALNRFTIGTFECLPFDVKHDAPEPLGFLLRSKLTGEKLLYFTDTPLLNYKFPGVQIVMAECNYDHTTLMEAVESGSTPIESIGRICGSHMGLDSLLMVLGANDLSQLRQIYLIHLSNRHANEQRIKKAIQEATGAEVIVC